MRLDLVGKRVEIVRFNYSLMLWTEHHWELDLAGHTTLSSADGRQRVVDTGLCQADLTEEADELVGRTITAVWATEEGELHVECGDVQLSVAPGTDHEAWQISGWDARKVVCMPGGELAIWD